MRNERVFVNEKTKSLWVLFFSPPPFAVQVSLPALMTFAFKRFDFDVKSLMRVKLNHVVSFPFFLDMAPFVVSPSTGVAQPNDSLSALDESHNASSLSADSVKYSSDRPRAQAEASSGGYESCVCNQRDDDARLGDEPIVSMTEEEEAEAEAEAGNRKLRALSEDSSECSSGSSYADDDVDMEHAAKTVSTAAAAPMISASAAEKTQKSTASSASSSASASATLLVGRKPPAIDSEPFLKLAKKTKRAAAAAAVSPVLLSETSASAAAEGMTTTTEEMMTRSEEMTTTTEEMTEETMTAEEPTTAEKNDSCDAADSPSPLLYELFSVLIHSGGAQGGHYYAFIKSWSSEKEWCRFDDSSVTLSSESEVKQKGFGCAELDAQGQPRSCSNAYMLMYRKVRGGGLPLAADASDVAVPTKSVPVPEGCCPADVSLAFLCLLRSFLPFFVFVFLLLVRLCVFFSFFSLWAFVCEARIFLSPPHP